MTLEDRKGIIKRLESAPFSQKNSVVEHRKNGDLDALKRRINCTVDELKKLAEELLKPAVLRKHPLSGIISIPFVTFAVLAVKGRKVPWNSNIIERFFLISFYNFTIIMQKFSI